MSVTRRPNEAALVTSFPDILQMYGWCVWALTMTLTRGSSPFAIASMSGPLKFTHLFTSVYSLPAGRRARECRRRRRALRAALVQQHDEGLDVPLLAQPVRPAC